MKAVVGRRPWVHQLVRIAEALLRLRSPDKEEGDSGFFTTQAAEHILKVQARLILDGLRSGDDHNV